jgi:ATP-dependent DNA helicase RecQ
MKVLIVAKTRRGGGACVGGITEDGRSVRLIAADAATNERAGLEYAVSQVWEIDSVPDPYIVAPHVENILVLRAQRLRLSHKVEETIRRFMPPVLGGPKKLFDGLTQATRAGGLYIAERTGLPQRSTMFWEPDQPLKLDCDGKRIRYRYPNADGGWTLTYVGFQEPMAEIPAGTLLRVSLAHRWRPQERPEDELRCFVQLSGWFLKPAICSTVPAAAGPGQTRRFRDYLKPRTSECLTASRP